MSSGSNSSLERLREEVIDKLSASYSGDYLDQTEFEERVEIATSAGTHAELRKLLLDLPLAGAPDAPIPAGNSGSRELSDIHGGLVINEGAVQNESVAIAIFSGTERKGVWDPPRTLNAVAVFGGCEIDLREARIPADGMTINAAVLFGGLDVIVPEDLNVEVSGAGIFGGFAGKSRKVSNDPRTPTVRISGVAIFGGVDVKIKRR